MSKAVLLGPYVGSFTYEVLVFRPYIRYISYITDDAELFVSSHFNRSFLYDWITPDNFLPIYEHITRNELKQVGFVYDDITKTEFNQITKKILSQIPHEETEFYTLPYVKNTNGIPFYQKIHTPFKFPNHDIPEGINVVAILDKSPQSKEVYELIGNSFDVTVIGDMNNGLEDMNVLMRDVMSDNSYIKMFNYIGKAKLVVTNCSDWVFICNCQGIPVFYWGPEASMFKDKGILNFDNNKCTAICEMDSPAIADMIKYCYERLYGGK